MVLRTSLSGEEGAAALKVHNVHSRELPVPSEQAGELLGRLGGEQDTLWPADRWPTTPFELDGPLAPGVHGRQGQIRQTVESYEPGRLVLRFAPGLGLVGTHRLEVTPTGTNRCRLVHTLDCRVEPKLLAIFPILIRQHDALVEDLLDRAELATTGQVRHPHRWPISVRVLNGLEEGVARVRDTLPVTVRDQRLSGAGRRRSIAGDAVPATLAALAALHAAWALGWRWPGGSDRALAERVVDGSELPPRWATLGAAGVLAGAAAVVRLAARASPSPAVGRLTQGVGGVLLLRGTVSVPFDLLRDRHGIYQRLDRMVYSPLCLALGGGAIAVARSRASQAASMTSPTHAPQERQAGTA